MNAYRVSTFPKPPGTKLKPVIDQIPSLTPVYVERESAEYRFQQTVESYPDCHNACVGNRCFYITAQKCHCGCGIVFSLPVVVVCYLIRHSDPTVLREHGGQLIFAAFATVAISIMMMTALGESRKSASRKEQEKSPTNK